MIMCHKSCDMPFWWPLAALIEKHENLWAWNGWCFRMSGVSAVAKACSGFCVSCWPSWTVLFQYTWDKEHVCLANIQTGGTPYVYFIFIYLFFRLVAIYYKTDDRAALSCVILEIKYLHFSNTDRTSFNLSVLLVLCLRPPHGQALKNLHFGICSSCCQKFLIYKWHLFLKQNPVVFNGLEFAKQDGISS